MAYYKKREEKEKKKNNKDKDCEKRKDYVKLIDLGKY